MNSGEIPVVETWGRRFSREAQRLAARRIPKLSWLRELTPLLERVTALPAPAHTRFKRVEATSLRRSEPSVAAPPTEEEGLPLPAAVRERLAPLGGLRLEGVRIHTGPKADAAAQEHAAEAVAISQNIYFREGRYRPGEPAGLALLAHEMEHLLSSLQPNAAWRRATTAGLQEEERRALARERQILAAPGVEAPRSQSEPAASADIPVRTLVTRPLVASIMATTPLQRPMSAEVGRNVEVRPPTQEGSSINLEVLRRELYRDLLGQIRADLERGA